MNLSKTFKGGAATALLVASQTAEAVVWTGTGRITHIDDPNGIFASTEIDPTYNLTLDIAEAGIPNSGTGPGLGYYQGAMTSISLEGSGLSFRASGGDLIVTDNFAAGEQDEVVGSWLNGAGLYYDLNGMARPSSVTMSGFGSADSLNSTGLGEAAFSLGRLNNTFNFSVFDDAGTEHFASMTLDCGYLDTVAVPEPSTTALLTVTGLGGFALWQHRRKKSQAAPTTPEL